MKHPRMMPDGKVTLINKGTQKDPNIVTVEDINNGTDITKYIEPGSLKFTSPTLAERMAAVARSLGVSAESVDSFVEKWQAKALELERSPRQELKYRLNCRLRGEDPGEPFNWRGLR